MVLNQKKRKKKVKCRTRNSYFYLIIFIVVYFKTEFQTKEVRFEYFIVQKKFRIGLGLDEEVVQEVLIK